MNEKLIAYNSKILRGIFVFIDILMFAAIIISVYPKLVNPWLTGFLIFAFIGFTIVTMRFLLDRSEIAFECDYENLVIYRNSKATVIPLSNITKIAINEMDNICGSFDATVHTYNKKYFMHMLIKDSHEVYEKFIKIMDDMGKEIKIREVSYGD